MNEFLGFFHSNIISTFISTTYTFRHGAYFIESSYRIITVNIVFLNYCLASSITHRLVSIQLQVDVLKLSLLNWYVFYKILNVGS